eukprot:jgi/Chlat1/6632/Chrsp482S06106
MEAERETSHGGDSGDGLSSSKGQYEQESQQQQAASVDVQLEELQSSSTELRRAQAVVSISESRAAASGESSWEAGAGGGGSGRGIGGLTKQRTTSLIHTTGTWPPNALQGLRRTASVASETPSKLNIKFDENDLKLITHLKNIQVTAAEDPQSLPEEPLTSPGRSITRRPTKETNRLATARDDLGNKYVNQYIILKVLGRGTFGKVKLCLNVYDGQLFAVKIINKKQLMRRSIATRRNPTQEVRKEIAIMKKLSHENIVTLHEVIEDPSGVKLYMVLEYVEHGPVMADGYNQQGLPEDLARHFMRCICKGLDYLHYHKIAHRDLKPMNLLKSSDGSVKISDFGVSEVFYQSDCNTRKTAGTPAYLAPEACRGGEFNPYPVDIWALGVCLYQFIFGTVPFIADTPHQIFHKICGDEVVFPHDNISPELRHLLRAVLTKDPVERITLPAIMAHPWNTRNGQLPLESITRMPQLSVSEQDVKNATTESFFKLFDGLFKERLYSPGEFLLRQGDEGDEMLFIDSGECDVLCNHKVHANMAREERLALLQEDPGWLIATREAGKFVGEMALFADDDGISPSSNQRIASVRAKTHVKVLVVTKGEVKNILAANANVRKIILETIEERRTQTARVRASFAETKQDDATAML